MSHYPGREQTFLTCAPINDHNEYTSESAGFLSLILFEQSQQIEEALKLTNNALAKNPKSIEALVARTFLYLDSGLYEQILIDVQYATEFHPKNGRT